MADAVDTVTLHSDGRRHAVLLTNISDGTGESGVAKIDISGLTDTQGNAPKKVVIEELWWNIQGFQSVRLHWDHTTDDIIAALSGSGRLDLRGLGGARDQEAAGGTGDVLLTTANNVSGNTYTIVIVARLKF
jgi:hypothetical protein